MKKHLLVLFVILMASCVPAQPVETSIDINTSLATLTVSKTNSPSRIPMPSKTPRPSSTPKLLSSLTSTPQPALVEHEWEPVPILIKYETINRGFCNWECPPFPLPFILYGDGTLIVTVFIPEGEGGYQQLFYKKLSQNEMCTLLNTIDQIGYFDFEAESYFGDYAFDASTWNVEVNAWWENNVSLYALDDLVDILRRSSKLPDGMIIPPSILNTYLLLNDYSHEGFSAYEPDKLVVFIWKPTDSYRSMEWEISDVSLSELYQKGGATIDTLSSPVILSGNVAKSIYSMLDNEIYYGEMTDGDEAYQVYIRPVLPFEEINGLVSTISPTLSQLELPNTMRCTPDDGILPIPSIENE